ncbi:hypothetical protein J7K50_09805 [bacterium]|nr:hypothetical protein [bacterium]
MTSGNGPVISGRVMYQGKAKGRIVLALTSFTDPLAGACAKTELDSPGKYEIRGIPNGIYYLNCWIEMNTENTSETDEDKGSGSGNRSKVAEVVFGPNRPIVITEKANFENIDIKLVDNETVR